MGEDKKKERKSKRKEKTEDKTDDGGSEDAPKEPRRAQRATSNVFALFNQSQIQEFKEVHFISLACLFRSYLGLN